MADPKLVELLKKGVPEWNGWRSENSRVAVDLSKADLREADLSWAALRNADLRDANLSYADLSWAALSWADLSGADLRNADLSDANLSGGNLSSVNLSGADLTRAKLSGANLSGADLRRAALSGADLTAANLSGANLHGAHLGGANLSGAELFQANLNRANFSRANLSGAVLYETVFGNTDLTNAEGLDTCDHQGPSTLDHRTLAKSGQLPLGFLRGCGLPDTLIDYLPSILNQAIQFYSCFISYSHEDKAFARRLHDSLQGRGIRCWLDEKQLLPRDDIHDQVDRGIRLWDKVLLCCSEHSLNSRWVDTEITKAFEKEEAIWNERKTKVLSLIPLNLDGYLFRWKDGKASIIRSRLAPDFRGWQESHSRCEEQIAQVVRALRADEYARERPPRALL